MHDACSARSWNSDPSPSFLGTVAALIGSANVRIFQAIANGSSWSAFWPKRLSISKASAGCCVPHPCRCGRHPALALCSLPRDSLYSCRPSLRQTPPGVSMISKGTGRTLTGSLFEKHLLVQRPRDPARAGPRSSRASSTCCFGGRLKLALRGALYWLAATCTSPASRWLGTVERISGRSAIRTFFIS
jgi:hypothetical protein